MLKDKVIGDNEKKVYYSDNHYTDELKRPLKWDPKKEKFRKDPEANTKLSRPLRKEWSISI